MENKIEKEAMFKITYGLFVLSAKDGEKDNGCHDYGDAQADYGIRQ